MKVLIWFGCIFVATILNTLLGYVTGIKAGYLVMYFGVYFVARKLCQKWDERKKFKSDREEPSAGEGGNGINPSANASWQCSCGRIHLPYETSCVCGKSKLEHKSERFQPITAAEVINKIRFCRKCGETLIDGSRFCRKCGVEVIDPQNTIMDQ